MEDMCERLVQWSLGGGGGFESLFESLSKCPNVPGTGNTGRLFHPHFHIISVSGSACEFSPLARFHSSLTLEETTNDPPVIASNSVLLLFLYCYTTCLLR